MRRSRKCALASAAARSQAGLWRAVMQALEQRVGSHSAVSGCPGSVVVTRLRQSAVARSEEHTSELQSLMRTSYAVFCLKKKQQENTETSQISQTIIPCIIKQYN